MPLFTILILVLSTIPLAASAPFLRARREASDKHPADFKNTTAGNDTKQLVPSKVDDESSSNDAPNEDTKVWNFNSNPSKLIKRIKQ